LRRAARAVALLVPAILLAGSLVLADRGDRPRVIILGPSLQHPIVARVREELTTLGFDVQVEIAGRGAVDLAAVARRFGAAAAARVEGAPPAIDLWVGPGRAEGSVITESIREPADPALLALRAVELLRARLLPVPPEERAPALDAGAPIPAALDAGAPVPAALDAGAPVPAAPVPAAPVPAAPVPAAPVPSTLVVGAPVPPVATASPAHPEPRSHPVALLAGPALLLSPGGVPAAVHVRFGAEWDPWPRVGFEAMAFVPATSGGVSAAEGSVDLRVVDFGGGIRGFVTDPLSTFSLAVGLGLQGILLVFEGRATPPWMDAHGSRWAAAPYASVSATYRFHPRVGLRLDISALLVEPQPVLRIAGRDVASFGQPAVFPSLAVEVRP
jgi:hypothetical protein